MLKKIKALLEGDPAAGLAKIDITALEAALADAQARRAALLLDGEVADVIAAERAIDAARIELERAHVLVAELERRKSEAEAAAAREALRARRAEAEAQVAEVVKLLNGSARSAARVIERALEAVDAAERARHLSQKEVINAAANGSLEDSETPYLSSVNAWLAEPDSTDLPGWFRAMILERTSVYSDL